MICETTKIKHKGNASRHFKRQKKFFLVELGIDPSASCMLGQHSTSKLYSYHEFF
jgi:hypothetical protein